MNYRIKTKMLLIILLGIFTTVTLVSGDCDVGTQVMKVVNFTEVLGTWYFLLHTANENDDKFKCVVATLGLPEENTGSVNVQAYNIIEKTYTTFYGNSTNWTNNTFDTFYPASTSWSGRHYVIATDYDSYVIYKLCSFQTNQLYVFVGFRSNRPDRATLNHVMYELQKNEIDIRALRFWPGYPCKQAESSAEE